MLAGKQFVKLMNAAEAVVVNNDTANKHSDMTLVHRAGVLLRPLRNRVWWL